jgi:peptidoglycan/LPS O-acetylase OafA/YrhL
MPSKLTNLSNAAQGVSSANATFLGTASFASLDGLRAVSILAVVWFHTAVNRTVWPGANRGFLGVDLFFIISGFLISTLLLRECRRTGTMSLSNFYVRRSLRIFPAYWLMLLFVTCIALLRPGSGAIRVKHDLPYALLYVSNLVPMLSLLSITWSLAAEEQFYVIVPALQKYSPRLFRRLLLPCFYSLAILPTFGVLPNVHMPDFFRQTTFGPILLGVMLAHALDSSRGWSIANNVLRSRYSPLIAIALVVLALSYPGEDISGWPRLAIQVSLLVLVASCVTREDHALRFVLTWGPVHRLGTVSYGIYLYHLVVFSLVSRQVENLGITSGYLRFFAVVICSWVAAEVSYRLIEIRFLNLKSRLRIGTADNRNPAEAAAAIVQRTNG